VFDSGGVTEYFRLDGGLAGGDGAGTTFTIFPDNARVGIGNNADLRLFHNTTDSVIQNIAGDLYIQNSADDKDILFRCDDGSGGMTAYLTLDGSLSRIQIDKNMLFVDSKAAFFGNSQDLQIYHDGSDSIIKDAGTGSLDIYSSHVHLKSSGGTNNLAQFFSGGHSYIYANNVLRIEASTSGVEITGDLSVSGSVQRQISTTHHTFTFGAACSLLPINGTQ
jgi:hypothetical protein